MSINCVIKGTLITLEGEEKKIENLKVGEKLLSYSVEGLENTQDKTEIGKTKVMEFDGEFSYQLIKNIWKNSKGYYKINDKLSITGDHFVMCKSQDFGYYWIKVEDLKIDDSLFRFNNEFEIINDIKKMKIKTNILQIFPRIKLVRLI